MNGGWRALLKCIICRVTRHDYRVIGQCGASSLHLGCDRCERQFGMNHVVRALLPWDAALSEFHRGLGYDEVRRVAEWQARLYPTAPTQDRN